jgi:hypothetical protein
MLHHDSKIPAPRTDALTAPTASSTTRDTLKIKRGYVPSPASYVRLFGKVDAGTGLAGWSPVRSVVALQAGDVIARYYDGGAASKPAARRGMP